MQGESLCTRDEKRCVHLARQCAHDGGTFGHRQQSVHLVTSNERARIVMYSTHTMLQRSRSARTIHDRSDFSVYTSRRRDWQTCALGGPLYPCVAYSIFHHTRAKNTTFTFLRSKRKRYFLPGYYARAEIDARAAISARA